MEPYRGPPAPGARAQQQHLLAQQRAQLQAQQLALERQQQEQQEAAAEQSGSSTRHIATEKRRRDRINEGYAALQELLPSKEKVDKATVLLQVVQYIGQIQTVLQEIIEHAEKSPGAVPEQLLWDLKVALPRGEASASSGPCAQSTPAAAPAATQGMQALLAAAEAKAATSAPAAPVAPPPSSSPLDLATMSAAIQATASQSILVHLSALSSEARQTMYVQMPALRMYEPLLQQQQLLIQAAEQNRARCSGPGPS